MPDFSTLLTGPNGDCSSKRVIGVGCFLCLLVALGADLLGHQVASALVNIFAGIVGVFMAAAAADHFAPKGPQ